MNDLHNSLAYTNSLIYGSSLVWDYHTLQNFNASDNMSLIMDASAASFSTQESDFSTGYLEDALIEFGESSKRRRLLPYTTDASTDDEQSKSTISVDDFDKNFWNSNLIWHQPVENFYCMDQIEKICGFSDEHISTLRSSINVQPSILLEDTKTTEETISASESPNSSSSSYNELLPVTCSKTTRDTPLGRRSSSSSSEEMIEKKKELRRTRVVYPFALVKPGGEEGDVTLNDINERILMAPTRPVRHPVGDFACRPCVSATGPGLSGKAVVALTRIHTQGRRGTITIIRTKG
ncbi:protein XRI1-like [Trifolium pratense]|uniref:protein XRI1-like n=1 Tax=Trifolium pratense TaxID=57577 RepID=UPI001E6951FD|nr:protein XRI1-like [Trifolium pratense]